VGVFTGEQAVKISRMTGIADDITLGILRLNRKINSCSTLCFHNTKMNAKSQMTFSTTFNRNLYKSAPGRLRGAPGA
jgi:hypothetical protein